MNKKIVFIALMCCMANAMFAQLAVKGKVTNEKGEPVPWANVWIEYTKIGCSTDAEGNFELNKIPEGKHWLRASAMDYDGVKREIVSSQQDLTMVLTKSPLKLNEVVVSGTGTHNRLKNSPIAVDVISKRELENANMSTFENAMTALNPSFSFTPNIMGSYMQLNGLGNKYILVLVDGKKLAGDVSRNTDLSRINMNNVKRIEILKGAASSLYGSDAIGGVINIITDKHKETVYLSSNTRYSEYGQFTQAINADINYKWLTSSTSYQRNQADGWKLNSQEQTVNSKTGEITYNDTEKKAMNQFYTDVVSQKFTFSPDDAFETYVQGSLFDKKYIRSAEAYDYNMKYNDYTLGGGAKYLLKNKGTINLDMYTDNYEAFNQYIKDIKGYKAGDEEKKRRQKYYDINLKSSLDFGKYNRVTLGSQYQLDYIESVSDIGEGSRDVYTWSAYAQDEIKLLNKKLQIVPGARFVYHEAFKNYFTPKLAAMYSLDKFNFRASYASGFRAPDMKELYINAVSGTTMSIGDAGLNPEKSNYFSLNGEYMHKLFTIGATAYVNKVKNIIVSKNISDQITAEEKASGIKKKVMYINSSEARIKGFDVTINSYLGAGLSLGLGYSFVDSKDYDTHNPLEKISKHSGTFNANWNKKWWIVDSNFNFNGRLQSKRYYSDGDARNFNLWNIATSHRFKSFKGLVLEPGLGIENIFNYIDDRPFGVNYATLSPGRTFYASLSVKFSK